MKTLATLHATALRTSGMTQQPRNAPRASKRILGSLALANVSWPTPAIAARSFTELTFSDIGKGELPFLPGTLLLRFAFALFANSGSSFNASSQNAS